MKTRLLRRLLVALAGFAGSAAAAEDCRVVAHEGRDYSVCSVSAGEDLRLFLMSPDGEVYGGFARINDALGPEGKRLRLAMNAGMYHADRRPVGLYIEYGEELAPIVTRAGPGNFGMLPNGVFCIAADAFRVWEAREFAAARPYCSHATQSGPLLVQDGALHPRFLVESDSRYIRNGVGTSADGRVAHFVISDGRVTLHEFARLFRDVLDAPDALYFDGNVSRLFAPDLGRDDGGAQMGPIVGLVGPAG